MMGAVTVTEEFLRWLADTHRHSEGAHGLIDGLEGAVGRPELARRAAEKARQEKAAAVGADPELVGDTPPGWARKADGTWEKAAS